MMNESNPLCVKVLDVMSSMEDGPGSAKSYPDISDDSSKLVFLLNIPLQPPPFSVAAVSPNTTGAVDSVVPSLSEDPFWWKHVEAKSDRFAIVAWFCPKD